MHKWCDNLNSQSLCMKFIKYEWIIFLKNFLKCLQSETIIMNIDYSDYQHNTKDDKIKKWINEVDITLNNK